MLPVLVPCLAGFGLTAITETPWVARLCSGKLSRCNSLRRSLSERASRSLGIHALNNLQNLPANLPVPEDDGACQHLPGLRVPAAVLQATSGRRLDLSALPGVITVVYCFPMLGRPDVPLPPGWDEVPGARGCTPESCGFRDCHAEMARLGVGVYGLSAQEGDEQREAATRLGLPFELLSDASFSFSRALGLPTFRLNEREYLKRLTLVLIDGSVRKVFYPIFPPHMHADDVLAWLKTELRS